MRIGIIAIQHESNTFLHEPTTLEDFKRGLLITGEGIRREYAAAHHEVGGFFHVLDDARGTGGQAIPLFAAWAVPSGVITAEAADSLCAIMLEQLAAAGPLDGLLVAPHGAAVAANHPDFDGHWLTLLRTHVGPSIPIICTLDLHANLTGRMIDACTATIIYRTNPHLDQRQRGIDAANLLLRTLRGEIHPTQAAAFPPVAINIERQKTDESPCRELYARADEQLRQRGVLSNSIALGFPYADVAEMGSAVVVVTDNDPALARRLADDLSGYIIERRRDFDAHLISIDAALDQAERLPGPSAPVCLLDMGDNVGGGSPGDGTLLAHAILQRIGERGRHEGTEARRHEAIPTDSLRASVPLASVPAQGAQGGFVCIADPAAAAAAIAAGAGAEISLAIGGKTDTLHGPPLQLTVRVLSLHDGKFTEPQPRHGGKTHYDMGPTAVVMTVAGNSGRHEGTKARRHEVMPENFLRASVPSASVPAQGGLTLMLTTGRIPPFTLSQLTTCGIDPRKFRLIIAKGVNAPVAAYREVCPTFIRVNTPGVTTADMKMLQYANRRRPLWPFEEIVVGG